MEVGRYLSTHKLMSAEGYFVLLTANRVLFAALPRNINNQKPTRAAASAFSTESEMEQKYRRRVVNQCRFESLKLVLQN